MKLWVDDERPKPKNWTHFAHIHSKTSRDAIEWLACWQRNNVYRGHEPSFGIEEVSLDHDLGGDDTGMIVLNWMIEHKVWPKVLTIHTSNPPARKRMLAAANAEAPDSVDIYIKTW